MRKETSWCLSVFAFHDFGLVRGLYRGCAGLIVATNPSAVSMRISRVSLAVTVRVDSARAVGRSFDSGVSAKVQSERQRYGEST